MCMEGLSRKTVFRRDKVVSIHAPRAGRDTPSAERHYVALVSIHAPRAGRDARCSAASHPHRRFNPRAPCGARLPLVGAAPSFLCFNPRAPCGARLCTGVIAFSSSQFQSTRPVRGATSCSVA